VPLKFLTPFAFLALLPLGGWRGGAWTFAAAAATPLCLASLDLVLGGESALPRQTTGTTPRWLPRIFIVLQLAATAWAAAWIAGGHASFLEAAGLATSAGVTTGVFGVVAAHEMIHSRSSRERALGLTLLGSMFYMHFRIAHVYGHHRHAATLEDPASARLGEGLYGFLARSITGQVREAWAFEKRRRRRNRMVGYVALELPFATILALFSIRAFAFVVTVAAIAIALLETFNYVAHYGLSRGRTERLGPRHSWNTGMRMNNAALFNMGRHSDHHRRTARSYQQLESLPGAAELPSGYAAALLTALVPPLWRRLMDPRAEAVMAGRIDQRQEDTPPAAGRGSAYLFGPRWP
jgi:alkane 1-monooxygenase